MKMRRRYSTFWRKKQLCLDNDKYIIFFSLLRHTMGLCEQLFSTNIRHFIACCSQTSSLTTQMINRDKEIEKKSFEMSSSDGAKKIYARRKINREIFTNNKSEKYLMRASRQRVKNAPETSQTSHQSNVWLFFSLSVPHTQLTHHHHFNGPTLRIAVSNFLFIE